MYNLGMFDGGAPDIDPLTGQPRRRPDGSDPANPREDLLGIATGQPAAPSGGYRASQPTDQPSIGLYSSAGGPGAYAATDVTDPGHPFHALGMGIEARKEEVRRKQEINDAQTLQQNPNPMTMPLPGSAWGANRFPMPPSTPQTSALGILGPAIFGAIGKLFAPGKGGGSGDDGGASPPQYGGLY